MANRYDPRRELAALADHLRRDRATAEQLARGDKRVVQAVALMDEAPALLTEAANSPAGQVEFFGR